VSRGKHSLGTVSPRSRAGAGRAGDTQDWVSSRLLSLHGAADYLGLSYWAVRDLVHAGTLKPVRLPVGSGRELRRVLLDRRDLDALIEGSKA
jgi:excisionase family DNA binding protein